MGGSERHVLPARFLIGQFRARRPLDGSYTPKNSRDRHVMKHTKNNLAASSPDKVEQLRAAYDRLAQQAVPPK